MMYIVTIGFSVSFLLVGELGVLVLFLITYTLRLKTTLVWTILRRKGLRKWLKYYFHGETVAKIIIIRIK
jgi:hypothetical protein